MHSVAVVACFACQYVFALDYPIKPIRIVAPSPAAGGVDAAARLIAQRFREAFGANVVVDNRSGAGGTIGADIVAKSAPDGYTLLLTNRAFTINHSLYRKLPYDSLRDIAQVSLVGLTTNALVVNPGVRVKSVSDLISLSKSKPMSLNYGSAGSGSVSHLAMAYFILETGAQLVHIPYKGGAPAVSELIAGQTQVMISTPPLLIPHVQTKRLVGLATTGAKRSVFLPDLPTLNESGVPDYEFDSWYGLNAPAKTPREIVMRLHDVIRKSLLSTELKQQLSAVGIEAAVPSSPEDFANLVRTDIEKMARIVKASGMTAE
jgi:tripartite-type tricarboxylate transporter receptor subunit TctC